MCKSCGTHKCKCPVTKVISRAGKSGPQGRPGKTGPPGPEGPPGPTGTMEQIISQSAAYGSLVGAVGTTGVGTLFTGLASNFFAAGTKSCTIKVGFKITASVQHTVTAYFRKNGVQVGPTFVKTCFPADYINFQTELLSFVGVNVDTLDFYIESTVDGAVMSSPHLLNYRQI